MSTQPTFPTVDPSALPAVDTLLDALVEQIRPQVDPARCAMVGIHSGGVWIAERLHRVLGFALPLGTIDVGLHRDDLETSGLRIRMRASMIPFEVAGADILLVETLANRPPRAVASLVAGKTAYAGKGAPAPLV